MTDASLVEKRVMLWRLAVWLVTLLLAYMAFTPRYPMAWQVAAFGVAVTLMWPLARRLTASRPATSEAEPPADDIEPAASAVSAPRSAPSSPEILLDLILVTALVHLSGGFDSVFAPLTFVVVLEAFALLGPSAALTTAAAAALLNLVHFLFGVTPQAAVLYGMATGTLLVSAALVAWSQRSESSPIRRSALLKTQTLEALEAELEEVRAAHEQLKTNYRDVAQMHREQKAQIDRLTVSEQLFSASATVAISEGNAGDAYAKLLRIMMERLDAGGGVLWLRSLEHTLVPQAVEGRVSASLREKALTETQSLTPAELRARCEVILRAAAPRRDEGKGTREENTQRSELNTQNSELNSPPIEPEPVVVVLLRDPADDAEPDAILGAVGICDPRGLTRFQLADADKLQSFAHPLAVALTNVEQRRGLQRRVRELSLLYDLSRLVQTATDMEQVYKNIVAQVQNVIPYENCTLFLLDKAQNRLEAKATTGRVVNLLDHISFEKGTGVSAWAAARGRQILIPDLQKEPNLLNVEMIPPRVRSFVAMPLRVQNHVVGVINLSHSRPNAFSEEDIHLLTILAGQAAVTIERTEVFHTLETLAITDGLTQVYNHRYLHRRLEEEVRRAKRYRLQLALLMIDIDWFKEVNDRYGHATGDAVLRDLAALFRDSVRETEVVARYGGEEFAILLTQTGFDQAMVAAERVRANAAAHTFTSTEGEPLRITVSVGMAAFPLHASSAQGLLEQADRALYAAKEGGRNQICAASVLAAP